VSPSSLPQSSTGRLDVKSVDARSYLAKGLIRFLREVARLIDPPLRNQSHIDVVMPRIIEAKECTIIRWVKRIRAAVYTQILDHLRKWMAIRSQVLDPVAIDQMVAKSHSRIRAPWGFGTDEKPRPARWLMVAPPYRRCTEDAIAARVQKPARTEEALRRGVPEDEIKIKKRRERHREYLRDHRGHFERVKPHFFAEDLCPSNATRFPLLFEDSADDLPLDHQSPESSPGTL